MGSVRPAVRVPGRAAAEIFPQHPHLPWLGEQNGMLGIPRLIYSLRQRARQRIISHGPLQDQNFLFIFIYLFTYLVDVVNFYGSTTQICLWFRTKSPNEPISLFK